MDFDEKQLIKFLEKKRDDLQEKTNYGDYRDLPHEEAEALRVVKGLLYAIKGHDW